MHNICVGAAEVVDVYSWCTQAQLLKQKRQQARIKQISIVATLSHAVHIFAGLWHASPNLKGSKVVPSVQI